MISSIIQIVAIALLCYALYRESKRDRLSELRKKEELQDLFREQQNVFQTGLKNLLEPLKAISVDEVKYMERQKEIREQLGTYSELIGELIADISQFNSRLAALETPIKIWGEAQTKNEIQKGSANRTLRRRIQEKDAVIASTRQTLKTQSDKIAKLDLEIFSLRSQLSDSRQAANDGFEYFAEELAAIRAWMNDRGIPSKPLEKHLSLHFKGQVPSSVFQRLKNEGKLFSALGETISQLGDAALKMASSAPKPSVPHTDGSLNAANS